MTQYSVLPAYEHSAKTGNCPQDALKWSNEKEPPAIGARIWIKVNGIGSATVIAYFDAGDWLGVVCKIDNPPEWYIRQNGKDRNATVFGAEIEY
jgi:hypothetical protein